MNLEELLKAERRHIIRYVKLVRRSLSSQDDLDIRLQVYPNSEAWAIRTGDSSYDLDHHGYFGGSSITRKTVVSELVDDLIEQVLEAEAQNV